MSGSLCLRRHGPDTMVNLRRLRRIVYQAASSVFTRRNFDLAVHVLNERRMTALNERYLRHRGSTDVITFDYSDSANADVVHAEIFVCLDEARKQARRFRTTWSSELVRYVVHGMLHLRGYDDKTPTRRKRMKQEEARLLKWLQAGFDLKRLAIQTSSSTQRRGTT